uniref:AT-hook-containing transcription factor-like n=1 Tax=Callorhinchus milii TaxID=7868 RepID=A0A4W3HJR0_CALMI|eukprot:gi/632981862/ref/XP_007907822.1/ PREDICTED: AT-hook-containing transcription factor-like [Callorhinchus milii]
MEPDSDEDLEEQVDYFFSQADEDGMVGKEETRTYFLRYLPGLGDGAGVVGKVGELPEIVELSDFGKARGTVLGKSQTYNLSYCEEIDPAHLSSSPEDASHIYDSELLEEDETLDDGNANPGPERDRELDMTEDEGGVGDLLLDSDEGTSRELDPEEEEEYSDLPCDEDEEMEELSQGGFQQPAQDYSKEPGTMDHGDQFSDYSNGSLSHSTTLGNNSPLPPMDCGPRQPMGTNSPEHCGDSPSLLPGHVTGRKKMARKEPRGSVSFDGSVAYLNSSLLSHLSVEDLGTGLNIEAETIPDSSCADSIDESTHRMASMVEKLQSGSAQAGPSCEGRVGSDGTSKPVPRYLDSQAFSRTLVLKNGSRERALARGNSTSPNLQKKDARGTSREDSPKPSSVRETVDTPVYGRGKINHPLPDFSKVEPRVKFPKDSQGYQKPKSKAFLVRSKVIGSKTEVYLQSPADIVRQVLQSSNECEPVTPTPVGAKVLEEFKSPHQASEMVYQLQEDYRRLLTKYAEAENTIDRLRIGAKVSLFAAAPDPGQSIPMASHNPCLKVTTIAIPRAQRAEISLAPSPGGHTEMDSAASNSGIKNQEVSECFMEPVNGLSSGRNMCGPEATTGECLTWALAEGADSLQRKMDEFEGLMDEGKVLPEAQLRAFQQLKDIQDTLERGYLQAREEHRGLQLRGPGSDQMAGDFDLNREVEGSIFRLGMNLEDLKERVDTALQIHSCPLPQPGLPHAPSLCHPGPTPAFRTSTAFPKTQPRTSLCQLPTATVPPPSPEGPFLSTARLGHPRVNTEVSSVSGDSEYGCPDPETLQHRHVDPQSGAGHFMDQHRNTASEPPSVGWVRGGMESPRAPLAPQAQRMEKAELNCVDRKVPRQEQEQEEHIRNIPVPRQAVKMHITFPSCLTGNQQPVLEREEHPAACGAWARALSPIPRRSCQRESARERELPHQPSLRSSTASLGERDLSPDPGLCRSLYRTKSVQLEDRIISPETDSGFVGSESSRLTAAAETPEHQCLLNRPQSVRDPPGRPPACADGAPRKPLQAQDPHQEHGSAKKLRHSLLSRKDSLAQPDLSGTSSPGQWAGSVLSEFEQETYVTQSESEADGQSCSPTSRTPQPAFLSSSFHPKLCSTTLTVRSARDEAIQALQNEVSQLKQRLEACLQRPQADSEQEPCTSPPLRAWPPDCQTPNSKPIPRASDRHRKQRQENGHEGCYYRTSSCGHPRSRRDPQHKAQLDISSEAEPSLSKPQPFASKHLHPSGPLASAYTRPPPCEGRKLETVRVKGPYTGTDYTLFVPWASGQVDVVDVGVCPHCGSQPPGNGPLKSSSISTSRGRQPQPCPLCTGSGTQLRTGEEPQPAAKVEPGDTCGRSRGARKQRSVRVSEAPPVYSCLPPPHYVPYSLPAFYIAAPASQYTSPTRSHLYYPSGFKVVEATPLSARTASPNRHRHNHHEAVKLSDRSHSSLDQAIEAARDMKWTSKRMVRALASDLGKARAVQSSFYL